MNVLGIVGWCIALLFGIQLAVAEDPYPNVDHIQKVNYQQKGTPEPFCQKVYVQWEDDGKFEIESTTCHETKADRSALSEGIPYITTN